MPTGCHGLLLLLLFAGFGATQKPPNYNLLPWNDCGKQEVGDRIFGGTVAALDEFPWLVLLQYETLSGRGKFLCGGALISHRYVLTAAHCLTSRANLIGVRLGEWDISTEFDCENHFGTEVCADPVLDVGVEDVIPHPKYNEDHKNLLNDIGIVRLDSNVKFTDYIKPICLPQNDSYPAAPGQFFAAGWGATETSDRSKVKLSINVPLWNATACMERYKKEGQTISTSQVCAGGSEGRDTCRGDSGGPLMKMDPAGYTAIGIASYGVRQCGSSGWPGVYTRVSSFIPWILDQLAP